MKVITLNVNGIRAAERKGLFEWLSKEQADIICLQEVRADKEVVQQDKFQLEGYHSYYSLAERKGYSGVAIYCKQEPLKVNHSMDWPLADTEGRFVQCDFDNLSVVSLYMPSGSHKDDRQQLKYDMMDHTEQLLKKWRRQKREWIICGDWNIAHTKQDIKNWSGNQKNSGFLPEERAWMDNLFGSWGYTDAFRHVNKEDDQYTWWSNRGRAWDNNVGWRIDYQVITPGLASAIEDVSIYKEQRFSDHSPCIIEYGDMA